MTGDFSSPTPAGWFPDPTSPSRKRYFDGTTWTEHYHYETSPQLMPPPPPMPAATTTPTAGWYADPDGYARRRYWDGSQWTTHYTDTEVAEPKATPWFIAVLAIALLSPLVMFTIFSNETEDKGATAFWVLFGGFFAVAIWMGLRSSAKRRRRQQTHDRNTALAINAEIEDDAYRRGDDQRGMHGQFPPST